MKTIWKFPLALAVADHYRLKMPRGARILCVQTQGNRVCLWAEVEPNAVMEIREFLIYGTGHSMTEDVRQEYIGTFQISGGALVFHVYEAKPEEEGQT